MFRTPILFDEDSPKTELSYEPPYVLDLHLSQMIHRLRSPAPPPPERDPSSDDLLPLPNTTPWQLPNTLRMLVRARATARMRARNEVETRRGQDGEAEGGRTIPGGLDPT